MDKVGKCNLYKLTGSYTLKSYKRKKLQSSRNKNIMTNNCSYRPSMPTMKSRSVKCEVLVINHLLCVLLLRL